MGMSGVPDVIKKEGPVIELRGVNGALRERVLAVQFANASKANGQPERRGSGPDSCRCRQADH